MAELLYCKISANFFMKCLFTEVHQFYLCSKKFPKYLNTVVFKYYCITEFVYVHQASTSLASKNWNHFQKKLHISGSFFFLGGGGGMLQPPFLKVSFPPHQITILT